MRKCSFQNGFKGNNNGKIGRKFMKRKKKWAKSNRIVAKQKRFNCVSFTFEFINWMKYCFYFFYLVFCLNEANLLFRFYQTFFIQTSKAFWLICNFAIASELKTFDMVELNDFMSQLVHVMQPEQSHRSHCNM